MIYVIIIRKDNDKKMRDMIHSNLRKNNIEKCKWLKENTSLDISISNVKNNNFLVFDNEKLIGGAIGFIEYDWYFLDLLYIDENYREKGIGSKLIKEVEKFAIQENLTGVRMETWDFQALEFYQKLGYKIFGEIKDCPPSTTCYFLSKYIKN